MDEEEQNTEQLDIDRAAFLARREAAVEALTADVIHITKQLEGCEIGNVLMWGVAEGQIEGQDRTHFFAYLRDHEADATGYSFLPFDTREEASTYVEVLSDVVKRALEGGGAVFVGRISSN